MLIGDGYDWNGSIGGHKFVYRPMLEQERRAVIRAFKWVQREDFAVDVIKSHIICGLSDQEMRDLDDAQFTTLWRTVLGGIGENQWFKKWEFISARNLSEGVFNAKNHPMLNSRTCESCRKWWYSDSGEIELQAGAPLERPEDHPVSCDTNRGCPIGHYTNQKRLSQMNLMAVNHFKRCKAIGQFPNDPIVARNAEIIQAALARR